MASKDVEYLGLAHVKKPIPARAAARLISEGLMKKVEGKSAGRGYTHADLTEKGRVALEEGQKG